MFSICYHARNIIREFLGLVFELGHCQSHHSHVAVYFGKLLTRPALAFCTIVVTKSKSLCWSQWTRSYALAFYHSMSFSIQKGFSENREQESHWFLWSTFLRISPSLKPRASNNLQLLLVAVVIPLSFPVPAQTWSTLFTLTSLQLSYVPCRYYTHWV